MFILLNKGVEFDQNFLLHTGLDGFLTLPMSNEEVVIPEELINSLMQNLQNFRGVGKTNQKPIKELVELLKKHQKLLDQHVDEKHIVEEALKQLASEVEKQQVAVSITPQVLQAPQQKVV